MDVEVPYRELGFQGVPFKQNVLMQPTQNCLVQLTEPPFLVVTMGDIEIAHLERVSVCALLYGRMLYLCQLG